MSFRISKVYLICFKFDKDKDMITRYIETNDEKDCQVIMKLFSESWNEAVDNDMVYCVGKDEKSGFGVVKGEMKLYSIEWSLNGRFSE